MGISNKIIIIYVVFIIISTNALAMDSSGSEKSSPEQLMFYLPSLTEMSESLVTNWNSLKSTVTNSVSDDAAFRKLGWPPSDPIAQEELRKSKAIYARVNFSIQNHAQHETFLEDCSAINRRTAYCQRALGALPYHSDGVGLAMFCLNNHQVLMNPFDLSRFLLFVNERQLKTKQGARVVDQELSKLKIVPKDNKLLNNLLKQSFPKEELEKHVELIRQAELKKIELEKQIELAEQEKMKNTDR